MGAKTWLAAYADGDIGAILKAGPVLDKSAAEELVVRLFGPVELIEGDGNLGDDCCPDDTEVCVGSFAGLDIICASDFALDKPSTLPDHLLNAVPRSNVLLLAMHSSVDWFAYALWQEGAITRSLSASPDDGVMEDIGSPLPFEGPFLAGLHPVDDGGSHPLPYHPLELGEEARRHFMGFMLEGSVNPDDLEPFDVPLVRFRRERRSQQVKAAQPARKGLRLLGRRKS